MTKIILKQKAFELRKQGRTYSEILNEIHVAKSTLSLWLKGVGLSVPQVQRITQKRIDAQRKGAEAQKKKRIRKYESIVGRARSEIGMISKRELWLIGISLYWAEGSKEKSYRTGCVTSFSNSDPVMINIFLLWLNRCLEISMNDVYADLYIHESHRGKVDVIIDKWSRLLNLPAIFIRHVYYKKNKINTKRKNTESLYIGLLRVNIRASSDLNRMISGWIKGISDNCGVV